MKKVKLFLVLCLASILSFGASIDSTSVAKTKVTNLDEAAIYNDGKAVLEKIAVGAGDLANNGYEIVVQQQRMYAFQYLIVGILCVICLIVFIRYYGKASNKESNTLLIAIIFGIISVWSGIVFSIHYNEVMQGLFNPDYAAIKDIVLMFKK